MNTGTSRASAVRKSGFICSMSGSGVQAGSVDSTSVAPSFVAEHRLDLRGGGGGDRHWRLVARQHQHRLADDADAHAAERSRRYRASSRDWRRASAEPTSAAPS